MPSSSLTKTGRLAIVLLLLLVARTPLAIAQGLESPPLVSESGSVQTTEVPVNPWAGRPECASMFVKADWQLTSKQRACNWFQNGLLSPSRLFSTAGSTGFSMVTDQSSERGDGFGTRFGRKWLQGALKTTAEYIGSELGHEDPRDNPPYLVLRGDPEPHGFFPRFGHAIARTVMTTQCVDECREAKHIKKRFRVSRLFGAVASGAGGALLNGHQEDRFKRAWHGAVSAYATSFGSSIFSEFKPELTAVGGSILRSLGVR